MDDRVEALRNLYEYAQANIDSLTPHEQQVISQALSEGLPIVQEYMQQQRPVTPSNDAQLLWILGGGNQENFVKYLSQMQTPETQSLLSNPTMLQRTIEQLSEVNPFENVIQERNGVPRSQLQSSNVFGSEYDPKTGKLKVQFQEGGLYEYGQVSPLVAQLVQAGAASAKTDGENAYGKWWKNKEPSAGAAIWKYLRNTGVPYRKVA